MKNWNIVSDGTRQRHVGRDDLVAQATQRLNAESVVWITGPIGVGKSAVAAAVVSRLESVIRCDASDASSVDEIVRRLAKSLDVGIVRNEELKRVTDRISALLRTYDAPVVFVDDYTLEEDLTFDYLDDCPGLQVVVSSRFAPSHRKTISVPPLSEGESLVMFESELERFGGEQNISDDVKGKIISQCDGLPLAIERAAREIVNYGSEVVLERFGDRSFFAGDFANALNASWDLLDEPSRNFVSNLSLFRTGFSVQSAMAILSFPLELLDRAVASGWLVRHSRDGVVRLKFVSGLRDFVANKQPPSQLAVEKFCEHYADKADQQASKLRGKSGLDALAFFRTERENIRNAISIGGDDIAVRICSALASTVYVDDVSDLEEEIKRALETADAIGDRERAARLRLAIASIQIAQGNVAESAHVLARANGDAVEGGHKAIHAEVKILSAAVNMRTDATLASQKLKEAINIGTGLNDKFLTAWASFRHGFVALQLGEIDQAKEDLNYAERTLRKTTNAAFLAEVLIGTGYVAFRRGELDVSASRFEDAIETFETLKDMNRSASTHYNAASVYCMLGNHSKANRLLDDAFERWSRIGEERYNALGFVLRGLVAIDLQTFDQATEYLVSAQKWASWTDDVQNGAIATGLLGLVARHEGNVRLARRRLIESLEVLSKPHACDAAAAFLAAQIDIEKELGDERASEKRMKNLEAMQEEINPTDLYFSDVVDDIKRLANGDSVDSVTNVYARIIARDRNRSSVSVKHNVSARELRVLVDGRGFWLADEDFVDLSSRKPLRLLLDGFTQGYLDHPTQGFSVDDLARIGWPDETISAKAAKNRVYTAIRFLRSCGLEKCIVTTPTGYRFADDLKVSRVDGAP